MNEVVLQHGERIRRLHQEANALADQAVEKARECGRLLTEVKAELGHGEFGKWIADNCGFTDRTARRYMRAYNSRHVLPGDKTDRLSDITPISEEEARKMARSRARAVVNAGGWLLDAHYRVLRGDHLEEFIDPETLNAELDPVAPEVIARALLDLDLAMREARKRVASYNKLRVALVAKLESETAR